MSQATEPEGNSQAKGKAISADRNICEHCNLYLPLRERHCPNCNQALILDSVRSISIWRLGNVRDGVIGHLAHGLRKVFGAQVVIQPAFLDERSSQRPNWKGISSTVFLNQVHRRHAQKTLISLGVTESNIVPDAKFNFLFGYAYMGLPASVVSLHPLIVDNPSLELAVERLLKIAVHEIGHNLGLDHHGYDDGIECVMVGESDRDSLDTVDCGPSDFCEKCARSVEGYLKKYLVCPLRSAACQKP